MRRGHLLALLLIVCIHSSLFSQTIVTLGTPTSTTTISGPSSTTSSGPRNERHMCIYTAAELTAAGVTSGRPIMNIGWEKTGSGFYNEGNLTFRVWLKHSTITAFPASPTFATETAGATLVYETSTGSIPAAAGWLMFPFNNNPSFTWNGTDNLQVITELIRTTDWTATGFSWRTMATSSNAAANANAVASAPPVTLTRTGTRPQIRLGISTTGDDAAITGITSPVSGPAGSQNINVLLRNAGTTTLTTADISVVIDGGAPTVTAWSGSLAPGAEVNFTAGSFAFANGNHTIDASVSNPNGGADADPTNNSFSTTISTCSPLAGAYTINSGAPASPTNFISFNAFANALSGCGVSGPVVATVAAGSGPYVEQVEFRNIAGLGATAPVTIEGGGATITSAGPIIQTGSNPDRHIIRLTDLTYFTVNNMNVDMVDGSTGFIGIHVLFTGDHITISNCTVDMGTGTSTLLGAIAATGSRSSLLDMGHFSNITFSNNSSSAGGYGAVIYGTTNQPSANNVISNNTFTGTTSNGIYVQHTDGIQVTGNTIDFAAANGIQLAGSGNINGTVQGNFISCNNPTSTLTLRGIYVFGSTPGTPNRVINNVIRNMNAPAATVIGITNRTSGAEFYFNTIILDDAAATGQRAFGFDEDLSNLGSILRNNIFYMSRASSNYSAAIALASTSTVTSAINSDYNTFFTANGAFVAVRKGSLASNPPNNTYTLLTDWQPASGQDANSFETDPQFQAGTAIPQSGVINGQGTPIAGITVDILGATRSNPPDPGAYEFAPPSGDAGITAFVLPTMPHCANTLDVTFTLTNAGGDPLNTATINWTVNGVPQPVVNWAGPTLASGASVDVILGNIPVALNTLYDLSATVSNPNGQPDVNPANDNFVYTGFRKGFESAVTINSAAAASPTNFQTFQSLADQLALYGVCAPVTITVSNGPYNARAIFTTIPGTSAVNTVTLDGNGQVLQFAVADMEEGVLRIDGVQHMIVENLTVNSTHATQGRGIHMTNGASKITIRNNTVNVSTTNSVSSSFGIIVSGDNWLLDGSLSDSIVITGNTVTGGYSAIQLSGEHWTQPLTRMTVTDNTVLDWYGFGVYLSYTNGALVSNNIIRRPTRTNSGSDAVTPAGITIPAGSLGFVLDKNRIYDLHVAMPGTSTISRGVYLSGTSIAPTSGTIQNNLIYGMNNNGAQYGIQNNSVNGPINIYHNTIVLDNATGASTSNTNAINMSNFSPQFGTHIINNVFVVTRGGTGIKRIIDVSTSTPSDYTSDYNIVYLNTTGGTQTYGQSGSNTYATLADWQAGTGRDANSIHLDPVFANPAAGDFTPTDFQADGSLMGTSSVGVTDDILGTVRGTNPDAGAFEFVPPPCSGADGGTAAAAVTNFCATGSTTLTATGYSTGIGLSYQWQSSTDNFAANVVDMPGQTNPATAPTGVITVTTYYRLQVTCSTGPVVGYSNIVTVTVDQPAVITANPVTKTVCRGDSHTFSVTATGALGYQWQFFDGSNWVDVAGATSSTFTVNSTVLNNNTNTYRVVVTGQCGPVNSGFATLYVNNLPTILLHPSAAPQLLPGQTLNITAQVSPGGGSYAWYLDGALIPGAGGSSLQGLTVDDAGVYHLVYTDPNGCVNTSATLEVSATQTGNVFIYPSPNNGIFQVRFYNQVGESATVSIFDSKGALMYKRQFTTNLAYSQLEISMGNVPAGAYLVMVNGAGGRKIGTRWIVVEK